MNDRCIMGSYDIINMGFIVMILVTFKNTIELTGKLLVIWQMKILFTIELNLILYYCTGLN